MSVVIAENTVVTLDIEMRDAQNALLRSDDSVSYLHGAASGLFDTLEAALAGKALLIANPYREVIPGLGHRHAVPSVNK